MLDVLVIAPHPDDAELGMGGTIALMRSQGLRVGVLDLTDGEPTPRGSRETRALETAAATAACSDDFAAATDASARACAVLTLASEILAAASCCSVCFFREKYPKEKTAVNVRASP